MLAEKTNREMTPDIESRLEALAEFISTLLSKMSERTVINEEKNVFRAESVAKLYDVQVLHRCIYVYSNPKSFVKKEKG